MQVRFVFHQRGGDGVGGGRFHIPTTDDVQRTEGDVTETVEWTFPGLLLQLFHQNLCLLIHHKQEVS